MRLWQEKRGEVSRRTCPAISLSSSGSVTEDLNRRWYEANTGQVITDVQRRVLIRHCAGWRLLWMGGRGTRRGLRSQVHAAVVVLGGGGGREIHAAAAAQYVGGGSRTAVLSIITGGGKWVEIEAHADPLYQHLIVTAERKFWRCVESGEPPQVFGVEPPKPRVEAIRIVDMSASNAWAEFAGVFARTRSAHPSMSRPRLNSRA